MSRVVSSRRLTDLLFGWELDVREGRRGDYVETKEMAALARELLEHRRRIALRGDK